MALTEEQKQAVASWIEAGAKPADVQARLENEFGLRVTYMEVRFLIDDLKVMPKDPPPPEPQKPAEPAADAAEEPVPGDAEFLGQDEPPVGSGTVKVKVDEIMRPGAMVSGNVTFSDGKKSDWYLDQYGRLGMVPSEPGYRPPQQDLAEFQMVLEKELMKLGF